MSYRNWLLAGMSLVLTLGAPAQQSGCGALGITVAVMKPTGEPIEGLAASDFNAQIKKGPVWIQSATYDAGPRRILLVIDEHRRLSADARKAEVEFAAAIVSSAQPGDSLALISARGSGRQVKFGADRPAVLDALRENGPGQKDGEKIGVMDAVAEGISWFGEPRLGDSIVVLALDLEGNHHSNAKAVTKMLEEHRIRLFGMALGPLLLSNSTTGTQRLDRDGFGYRDPGMPLYDTGADANFFPLTVNSGGYIVQENTMRTHQEFKLNDGKKKELEKTASVMSTLIDKLYALQIQHSADAHSEPWTVSLAPSRLQSLPGAKVLYPHELGVCTASAAIH